MIKQTELNPFVVLLKIQFMARKSEAVPNYRGTSSPTVGYARDTPRSDQKDKPNVRNNKATSKEFGQKGVQN